MARRRMIDPLIWEDEHFGSLSDKARVLFIACISNADDDGRLSGNPSNLRAIAFRFDDISLNKIEDLVKELAENLKRFTCYDVSGCKYIQLEKWEEYQKQREERRVPSKLPDVSKMSPECPHDVAVSKDKLSKDKLSKDNICPATEEIISDLNSVLGSTYKASSAKTRHLIEIILSEGFTIDDFKSVHRKKFIDWANDAKMRIYLRPITLYGTKFESYLNQPNKPISQLTSMQKANLERLKQWGAEHDA